MTRLAFFLLGLLLAVPAPVLAQDSALADDPITLLARTMFKEGVESYDKGEYEQARFAFLQVYALKKHPSVLLNLAWSCLNSGRRQDAEGYFKQFLSEAKDITDKQRAEANDGLRWAQPSTSPVSPVRRSAKRETDLPTYTYAIQSGTFVDAGVFTTRLHYVIPNTVWLCDVGYGNQGLLVRCSAPSSLGEVPEVITRVSCAKTDSDTESLNFKTLDDGFAGLTVACKRLEPVDGPRDVPPAPPAQDAEPNETFSFLNINSIPPSTCFLDGHPLGATPRIHVSVTPGTHSVYFNTIDGVSKALAVFVSAGETKTVATKLANPAPPALGF